MTVAGMKVMRFDGFHVTPFQKVHISSRRLFETEREQLNNCISSLILYDMAFRATCSILYNYDISV